MQLSYVLLKLRENSQIKTSARVRTVKSRNPLRNTKQST